MLTGASPFILFLLSDEAWKLDKNEKKLSGWWHDN